MACAEEVTTTDKIRVEIGPDDKYGAQTIHVLLEDKLIDRTFIGDGRIIAAFQFSKYFMIFSTQVNSDSDNEYIYVFNHDASIFECFSIFCYRDEGYIHDISIKSKNTIGFIYELSEKNVYKNNFFDFEIIFHETPIRLKNFRFDLDRYFKYGLSVSHNKFLPLQNTHYELKLVGCR